jgi:hypothetical protein
MFFGPTNGRPAGFLLFRFAPFPSSQQKGFLERPGAVKGAPYLRGEANP